MSNVGVNVVFFLINDVFILCSIQLLLVILLYAHSLARKGKSYSKGESDREGKSNQSKHITVALVTGNTMM